MELRPDIAPAATLPAACVTPAAEAVQNAVMDPSSVRRQGTAAEEGKGLAALYDELRGPLLSFLRKHTGDAQVAEDLLHDVVLKALAADRNPAGAPRNLTGWLYAVARNAAMDHHRRQRPTEALPDDLPASNDEDDDPALAALSNCLRPVAEDLPETYRATLIAAEFEGRSLADVARAQGISLSAAKTRASRGRRLLQQQVVACCRVALSARGEVLDYDPGEAARCASGRSDCKARRPAGR